MNLRRALNDFKIAFNRLTTGKNIAIPNYYKTNFSKKLLLSYLTDPFTTGVSNTHTNTQRSTLITEVFKELGYNIDIIHSSDATKLDYAKYDIIFGQGLPFENSFYAHTKAIRLYFGTGIGYLTGNALCLARLKEVQKKTGVLLPESARLDVTSGLPIHFSDAIITFGNDFVINSYKNGFAGTVHTIPMMYYQTQNPEEIINARDIGDAKKHYLFISGSGLVRKGLDLVLEAFKNQPDLHVHICAPLEKEKRFVATFKEYFELPNIHTYGFVDVYSELYKELLTKCAFIISPACADACPSALTIPLGSSGTIPVITYENGFPLLPYQILIKSVTLQGVSTAITESQRISDDALCEGMRNNAKYFSTNCTDKKFKKGFKDQIEKIISLHNRKK